MMRAKREKRGDVRAASRALERGCERAGNYAIPTRWLTQRTDARVSAHYFSEGNLVDPLVAPKMLPVADDPAISIPKKNRLAAGEKMADETGWETATSATTTSMLWMSAAETAAARLGCSSEDLREPELRARAFRAFNAGETVQMAAETWAFVSRQRGKKFVDTLGQIRSSRAMCARALRK